MTAAAAALAAPLSAAAQFCAPAPKSVPHLNGAPHWLSSDTSTSSALSPWLNDPRFSNASLTPYGATTDNASFRVTYDNQYLIVSFQTPTALDDVADNRLDAVVFGVSNGTTARAVKIALPAKGGPADQPMDLATSGGFTYSRLDSVGGTWTTSAAFSAPPAWLVSPAAWVNEVRDGAAWGVNFKVNLNDLDESSSDNTNVKYAMGSQLRVTFGTIAVNPTAATVARQKTPDVPLAGSQTWVFSNDQMVNSDPTQWLLTDKTGDGCTGISLPRSSIGVKTNGAYENPSNWFALNSTPTLVATPVEPNSAYVPGGTEPEFLPPADNSIAAKFRVANWGSQATTAGWSALKNSANLSEVNISGGHFDFTCPAGTSTTTCGVTLAALDAQKPGQSHQCMLVEMRSLQPGVNFSSAAEYRNMHFETASTIDRIATLNVKGLQAVTGNTNAREVYLYVRRRNMPASGSTQLQLPRLQMFQTRARVTGEFTCKASESCQSGECATVCQYPNNAQQPCGPNLQHIQTASGCYCTPYEGIKACLPPDPLATNEEPALGDEQKLATIWPTIEVFPYWSTGKNVTMNGKVYKEMKPMSPFGMFVDHAGVYYGFTSAFAGTDVTVTQVATDIYKLTIPNEGSVHVKMTVTAVEQAQPTLLLAEIGGSVSGYGNGNQTVTVTAIAASTSKLDLSRATFKIEKLLVEGTSEHVTNLPSPDTLSAFPFGLPFITLYGSTSGPPASALVFDLPLIGRFTQTTVTFATVTQPAACGLFGGTVNLKTRYTINDGINPALTFEGTDKWSCDWFHMWN